MAHMEVGVRMLRNRTAEVIAAVESASWVTLTVRGTPVADIVPRGRRARWLSGEYLSHELADALIAATAVEHGLAVVTLNDDFDTIAIAHPLSRSRVCKPWWD